MSEKYDEDYFERGPQTGKSLYENYRWMPDETIQMARSILSANGIKMTETDLTRPRILDYGCAKGFLVQAMETIGVDAFGADVSRYALENASRSVAHKLVHADDLHRMHYMWDLVIAKDVLEHMTPSEIDNWLLYCSKNAKKIFIAVPLGDDGLYRIPEYERDVTHIIRENESWWLRRVFEFFDDCRLNYRLNGIKGFWVGKHPKGNLFIRIENELS